MSDYDKARERLEPGVSNSHEDLCNFPADLSIAISLKRIADALEAMGRPYRATAKDLADETTQTTMAQDIAAQIEGGGREPR